MNSLKDIFKKADINVSLLGINIGVKNETLTVNDETILRQMLGYLYWDNNCEKEIEEILPEYDYALREYSYDKIWSELSDTDKKIICELAKQGTSKVKDIRKALDMSSQKF